MPSRFFKIMRAAAFLSSENEAELEVSI